MSIWIEYKYPLYFPTTHFRTATQYQNEQPQSDKFKHYKFIALSISSYNPHTYNNQQKKASLPSRHVPSGNHAPSHDQTNTATRIEIHLQAPPPPPLLSLSLPTSKSQPKHHPNPQHSFPGDPISQNRPLRFQHQWHPCEAQEGAYWDFSCSWSGGGDLVG